MALHSIFTKRGLTAPRRIASRRGISYYPRYETQTYSLTAIGLRLEHQEVVGRCIFILPRTSTSLALYQDFFFFPLRIFS